MCYGSGAVAREDGGPVGQRAWLEWGVRDWRERQFLMVPSQGLAFLWSFSPNDCVFIEAAALRSATSSSRLPGDTSMAFLWTMEPSPPLQPTGLVCCPPGPARMAGPTAELEKHPSSDYVWCQWPCPVARDTTQGGPKESEVQNTGLFCNTSTWLLHIPSFQEPHPQQLTVPPEAQHDVSFLYHLWITAGLSH